MLPSSPGAQMLLGPRRSFIVTINRRKDTKRPPGIQKKVWNALNKNGAPCTRNFLIRRTKKMSVIAKANNCQDVRAWITMKPLSTISETETGLLYERLDDNEEGNRGHVNAFYLNPPSATVTPRHGDPPVMKTRDTQTPATKFETPNAGNAFAGVNFHLL